jgi:hypothetical protein
MYQYNDDFAPEDSTYDRGILVCSAPFYLIGIGIFGYLICYLYMRLLKGKCGGYKSKKPKVSKKNKRRPMTAIILGAVMFIGGFVLVLIFVHFYS